MKYKKINNFKVYIIEFNDLYNSIFNRNRSVEKAEWEFLKNPYLHNSNYFLFNNKEKIIGHWGFIPNKFIIDNIIIKSGKIENSMIKGDYRKKGIYKNFEKSCLSDIDDKKKVFIWSISTISAIKLRLKLGYQIVGGFKTYEQVLLKTLSLKKIYILFKFFCKEIHCPKKAINNFLNRTSNLINKQKSIDFKTINFKELSKMLNKINSYNINTILRETKYMQWRFENNPNIDYKYYQSIDKLFYVIISIKKDNVFIHDMGYIESGSFNLPPIKYIKSMETVFAKSGFNKLNIKTIKNGYLSNQLLDNGYFISKNNLNSHSGMMVYRYNNIKINFKDWYFTNIFSEGIK